jgi:hypothetical protein
MVVANNKINGDKKYTQTLAILMAMRIRWCDAGRPMEHIHGFM